jgi:hypothetical protein
MKRLGRMLANLGSLYGRLYGAGNSGSILAENGTLRPSPPRRAPKKQAHKQRRRR